MICAALILSGTLIVLQDPAGKAATAADRITLRDGSVVLGLVTSIAAGPRGGVDVLVRRDWADKSLESWAKRWSRGIEQGTRLAVRQRRDRLRSWRRARSEGAPADDRIIAWIDAELKRLDDPARSARTPLMPVHLARGDVRNMARAPLASNRLLQLGWLCGLKDVEAMPLEDLKDALEGRGFAHEGEHTPSLAGLLPPSPESDLQWQARRAATELAVDPDLRFLRYQGMILPDVKTGQPLGGLNLSTALSEITKLLDPAQGQADPLAASLKKVAERGRVGAVVTGLEIPADLSQATAEVTFWVRASGDRWVPFGSRKATVRPDEVAPEAGKNLAGDPQVQTAFSLVESLGLGSIPPELKERSLRMGAATEKALDTARAEFSQDLEALRLPVLEAGVEVAPDGQPVRKPPNPGIETTKPRR
jgi:hypothetical protein